MLYLDYLFICGFQFIIEKKKMFYIDNEENINFIFIYYNKMSIDQNN